MKIPNLPTDNLYKFISIFGLVLFVLGAYLYNTTFSQIYLKLDDYNLQSKILKIKIANDSVLDLSERLAEEQIKLDIREKQLNREIKSLPKELKMYFIISLLGIPMIGFGFFQWYARTQYFNDKILKNESESLKNNKEISVHKLQFEKEFSIYDDLWKCLIELRNSTGSLRPQLDYINPNENEEERKKNRLEKFNVAFSKCVISFENNKPFYPKEVYDDIEKTIRLARKEVAQYSQGRKNSKEYWENAEKNIDEIIDLTNIICDRIRERIGIIKVKN